MAKRRTKKQKSKAKHNFELSWSAGTKSTSAGTPVKGQKKKSGSSKGSAASGTKSAQSKEEIVASAQVKRDIGKSLAIASLVLGIELVIYFVS